MEDNSRTTVDHFVTLVSDLEESIKWYTTSFSCDIIYKSNTLAILQFENIKLVLSLPSEQRVHLAFFKDDAENFGEIREQGDQCLSTFISDPSGNPVELVKKPFYKEQ